MSATGAYAVTFRGHRCRPPACCGRFFVHAMLIDIESLPTGMAMCNCCASADTALHGGVTGLTVVPVRRRPPSSLRTGGAPRPRGRRMRAGTDVGQGPPPRPAGRDARRITDCDGRGVPPGPWASPVKSAERGRTDRTIRDRGSATAPTIWSRTTRPDTLRSPIVIRKRFIGHGR